MLAQGLRFALYDALEELPAPTDKPCSKLRNIAEELLPLMNLPMPEITRFDGHLQCSSCCIKPLNEEICAAKRTGTGPEAP